MPHLHECQAAFTSALLDPRAPVPAHARCHTSDVVTRRFNVYRNNVIVSLIEALAATFPVVRRLVGDEFFNAMTREFVLASPPRSPILSRYGGNFADFLRDFGPVSDLPYLADVARLEWLQLRAYHAADAEPLGAGDFASVDPQAIATMRIALHPSAMLFSSPFPCVSIWRTNTHDEVVKPVEKLHQGEDALVLRSGLATLVLPLQPGGYCFVDELRCGKTLGAAYAVTVSSEPAFDVQFALAALIDCGAVTAFDLEGPRPQCLHEEHPG